MGKGDIKSKRGKIANKSYGVRRLRTTGKLSASEIAEAKAAKAIQAVKSEKAKPAKKEAEVGDAKKAVKAKAK
ncbi:MAG: 30S ribosomal protein THX [Bacteroidia bacterium]|nr:30S ribosomal protein THX [Bacteroidia bacterium]